jgi:hypothetical protein
MPSVTGVTNPEKCHTLSDHAKNLLAVLTLASSVEAECAAWVLWDQSYAVNSFETRQECQLAADRLTQETEARRRLNPPLAPKNDVEALLQAAAKSHYRCFPDTFDPRGPKGSGR